MEKNPKTTHAFPGRLSGQVIIVTGGNKGIGLGVARRLATEGATVVITGRDESAGVEAVREYEQSRTTADSGGAPEEDAKNTGETSAPGQLKFIQADNANPEDIGRVVATTVDEFGTVTGLVNNAATMWRETILTTKPEIMQQVLSVNLVGAVEYSRLCMEQMIKRGSGSIVMIGSTHAWSGLPDLFPYSISKGGLLTLTHHIARNYADKGIRCNWVTVGWIITPGEIEVWRRNGKDIEWIEQKGREVVPLGRLQTPEEIGASVAFLFSDEANQITDTELDVAGGLRV